jgi:hypothetical protein
MNSFKCELCNITLSSNRNLQNHIKTQTCLVKLNVFKCNCGKEYKSVKWYDKHIITCENKGNQTLSQNSPKLSQNSPKLSQNSPKLSQNSPKTSYNKYPNNDCPYCGKHYTHSRNIPRHIRISCKKVSTLTNTQESSNVNINNINNINNTTNIQVNNTNNFVLNNFGHENLSHLTVDDKVEICSNYMDVIANTVTKIYFDPDHPENHTVRMKSEKNKQMYVYDKANQIMNIKPLNNVINFITTINYARVCKFMTEPEVINKLSEEDINSFKLLKLTYKLDYRIVKEGMNEDTAGVFLSQHYKKLTNLVNI